MKKKLTSIIAIVLVAVFAAVGVMISMKEEKQNQNSNEILISVHNGGYGTAWAEEAVKEFNKTLDGYYLKVKPEKKSLSEIKSEVKGGYNAAAYFTTSSAFQDAIQSGMFVDLSDVLTRKVDGETGMMIGEKMYDKTEWLSVASDNDVGCYSLPYAESLLGFVFDYDYFYDKNFLIFAKNDAATKSALTQQGIVFTESGNRLVFEESTGATTLSEGEFIAAAGRDGLYGTYDDGQPNTVAEWQSMINRIFATATKDKAFIWTGMYADYVTEIFTSFFAQYIGLDAFNAYLTFDSKGTQIELSNGSKTPISIENGYQVYDMKGLQETMQFMNDYLNNTNYIHGASTENGTAHKDAQNYYLLGLEESTTNNPTTAMLVEGVWWENEAKTMFQTIEGKDRPDFKYGVKDFRYMFLPHLEGSQGLDGNGNGSIICAKDTGGIFVCNNYSEEVQGIVKDFIAYTLSDSWLKKFTLMTGAIRPYTHSDFTTQEESQLTNFTKTVFSIYEDTENVKIVKPNMYRANQPIVYMTSMKKGVDLFPMKSGGVDFTIPLTVLRRENVTDAVSSLKNFYSPSDWADYVAEARNAGYYKLENN